MKVFDSSSFIAFVHDVECSSFLERLSNSHRIIIPRQVLSELTRPKTRSEAERLINDGIVETLEVDSELYTKVRREHPSLGPGECGVVTLSLQAGGTGLAGEKSPVCVCDDKAARTAFPGVRWVWTEELLEFLRGRGLIDEAEYSLSMTRLRASPFFGSGGAR